MQKNLKQQLRSYNLATPKINYDNFAIYDLADGKELHLQLEPLNILIIKLKQLSPACEITLKKVNNPSFFEWMGILTLIRFLTNDDKCHAIKGKTK